MIQIIDQAQKRPKFMDMLLKGTQQATQQLPGFLGNQAENQSLQGLIGQDLSGLSPEIKQVYLSKLMSKKAEDTHTKQNAIESIGRMREILSRGRTGKNFLNYATEEGRADRAAMDTAALNLEKIAADMVGKGTLNQQRFQYLKERLPSSWKTDAENKSILDEWEQILGSAGEGAEAGQKSRMKFNPSHPEHKAKATQLYKTYKDKEKVRQALSREFDF